jgi:hypothetical protein
MVKQYFYAYGLGLVLGMGSLSLQAQMLCEEQVISQSPAVSILPLTFEDSRYDLALRHPPLANGQTITRLSFGGSQEAGCHFKAVQWLKGGDWGWHVLWTSTGNPGVYYARVDGEAWVSSLPKRLSKISAEQLELSAQKDQLIIKVNYPTGQDSVEEKWISDDEGRSWEKQAP